MKWITTVIATGLILAVAGCGSTTPSRPAVISASHWKTRPADYRQMLSVHKQQRAHFAKPQHLIVPAPKKCWGTSGQCAGSGLPSPPVPATTTPQSIPAPACPVGLIQNNLSQCVPPASMCPPTGPVNCSPAPGAPSALYTTVGPTGQTTIYWSNGQETSF